MKILLLIGGLLGFGIGFFFSWVEGCPAAACLWRASLAAYLTAFLMRWWGRAWRRNLADAMQERQSKANPINLASLSKANKS